MSRVGNDCRLSVASRSRQLLGRSLDEIPAEALRAWNEALAQRVAGRKTRKQDPKQPTKGNTEE